MDQSIDVVDLVSKLLDSGQYKEALNVPNNEKYVEAFKNNCWDLISLIVSKIKDDTMVIKPSLHGACEELLSIIVQEATPEEALLEFIEQIEVATNDAQFSIILIPLQQLLKKLTIKRGRSLEWCLNSISTYIDKIPISGLKLEGKERLLLDSDINIRRVIKVYSMLPHFYTPFIKELLVPDSSIRTKQIIVAFLISLLGKPLIYIDLDPDSNAKSEARQGCATIINDICCLEKDLLKFLSYIENLKKENKKLKSKKTDIDDEKKSPYDYEEKINMTTLSSLFYITFSGHFDIPDFAIPQVYSIEYIVNTTMFAVNHLLNFSEYGPLAKATFLCKGLFNRLPNDMSHTLLSVPVHFTLCRSLINTTIYSEYESIRKSGLQLISCHINKFGYRGRYILIQFLIENAHHSGIIGYAITLFKNSIDKAFTEPNMPDCFTGKQLMTMIKAICYLPYGAESDLMELADQIISTLNILRYLALKDINNNTGIRDGFATIESDYLDKLRTGLNMSKAHYEVKLKDIEEGKDHSEEPMKVSLNVGGNMLDQIPTEKKKEIILSALNAFHLIEGLVARVSECFNINKMQGIKDCE